MALKPNEVKTVNIATYAVTESKLANNSVITDKIADGAIKAEKIGDKQVTGNKLADRSVTSDKVVDNAITSSKIADGAVTRSKISDGALGRPLIPPVENVEIGAGAVGSSQLAVDSVESAKIKDGAVTNAKLASNTITASKIAANAVGSSEIAAGAVGTSEIANGAVTPEKLSFVPGGAVRPLVPPLTTDEISAGAVASSQLAVDSVITEKIANQAVTGFKIQDASITPEKLSPTVQLGDGMTFLTPSIVVLYLTAQSSSIPETEIDLSAIIPVGAKAVMARAQIYTESATPGNTQFIMHLRKPGIGGEPSVRVGQFTASGREAENDGFCPVDANRKITYQVETGPGTGNTTATFIVAITAYVM